MRRAAVEDEESAAEVICEGNSWRRPRKRRAQRRRRAAAAAEKAATSRGDWGVKSMQGVRTGNAARCLEVGLVSAWKIDETGPEVLAKMASKGVRGVGRGNFTRGLPPRGKGRELDGERASFQTSP